MFKIISILRLYKFGGHSYLPKFNTTDPKASEYLLKVSKYWIEEYDIDGWRLDTPWKLSFNFLRQLRDVIKKAKKDTYIVGEIWGDPTPWLREQLFDGIMNYQLRYRIIDFCIQKQDAEDFDLEINYQRDKILKESAKYSLNLLGSHDTARIINELSMSKKSLSLALVFLFTYIGAPMIYYGDETGMTGENDPDCRKSMVWDKNIWDKDILFLYKKLIKIRKKFKSLREGLFETIVKFNHVYAFRRAVNGESVLVILNSGPKRRDFKINFFSSKSNIEWEDLLGGGKYIFQNNSIIIYNLEEKSFLILTPIDLNNRK